MPSPPTIPQPGTARCESAAWVGSCWVFRVKPGGEFAVLLPTHTCEERAVARRVVIDVMPKREILDPQGQAVVGALPRLGFDGVTDVRQGKRFELDVADTVDDETLERIAGTFLANPVIEDWTVRRVAE